ncbi:uncharacterized protein [Diabrotica undecimpunctata]|uniref:uncharacterized protein n=1 Tax=Diabrotica undecimpunctata TaxID=50387 RepID=UPI003B638E3D
MNKINRTQILKLYKELLRYSEELKFTDKEYFRKRIKKEFQQNRDLVDENQISLNYKKGVTLLLKQAVQ